MGMCRPTGMCHIIHTCTSIHTPTGAHMGTHTIGFCILPVEASGSFCPRRGWFAEARVREYGERGVGWGWRDGLGGIEAT